MPQINHIHYKGIIKNVINNPIISNPNTITIPVRKFFISSRSWIISKFINSSFNIGVKGLINFYQSFDSFFL